MAGTNVEQQVSISQVTGEAMTSDDWTNIIGEVDDVIFEGLVEGLPNMFDS
jgi:hypothetical protein